MTLYKYFVYDSIEKYIETPYSYSIFAMVLFAIRIANIFKKHNLNSTRSVFKNNLYTMFIKGFLINFINPFVLVFWLGVFKYSSQKHDDFNQFVFLGSSLVVIFIIYMLKVVFSAYLKKHLSPK
tara:strand:- start:286 stop:657 length:372 start_codon:yes stop_codon:yes gene_type:complete